MSTLEGNERTLKLRLNRQERLLEALAEEVKMPLMQIARQVELQQTSGENSLSDIESTADSALRLVDSYLLSTKLARSQNNLQLEPVSVSAVLHDTAHQLNKLAKQYDCELQLHLAGRYEPVMAHRAGLEAALLSLGYVFIETEASAQKDKKPIIKLAAHRGKNGIVAGLFAGSGENLSTDFYKRGRGLYGRARQPLVNFTASSSAGIFVAESLLASMSAKLRIAHHQKLTGLAATLLPSQQTVLVNV